ncbi:MAG: phosphotransferase system enzyme component [Gemmatimonadetes bacterium]|jgi:mannose/fructose-specific phosphotransferase system component IIA|nr:phosphotransferase system enzyme component [Gemmatimonadota bacterium]
MSEPLRGVIVCHGGLARALMDATAQISGVSDALTPVSNSGCDRGDLEARVAAAVGTGPTVVFVDMASGSCLFAVLRRLRERPNVRVVTGVNLAMLLDFVFHRDLSPDEAATRAVEIGEKAIQVSA